MGWEAQAWHTLLPHRASGPMATHFRSLLWDGCCCRSFFQRTESRPLPSAPPRAGKVAKPLVSACWVVTASVGGRTPDAHLPACPAFTHTVDLGTLWHLTPLASSSPGNPK